MEHQSIDKLLDNKIGAAHRGRVMRSILLTVAALVIIGGAAAAVLSGRNTPGSDPVPAPTPIQSVEPSVQPEASPEPTDEPGPVQEGSITHEIQVVWFGEPNVPESLKVSIMHDRVELFTAKLTKAENWRYTWTDDHHAAEIELQGDYPVGIRAEYTASGENFTITATCTNTEILPQTGSELSVGLLMLLAGAALATMGFVLKAKELK